MLQSKTVVVDGAALQGIKVEMPKASVLMLEGSRGFLGCGYFKVEVADKVGHAVAIVTGVSSFEDMLVAKVVAVSAAAALLGITAGMSGADAARRLA